jgi:hypothetical protein
MEAAGWVMSTVIEGLCWEKGLSEHLDGKPVEMAGIQAVNCI